MNSQTLPFSPGISAERKLSPAGVASFIVVLALVAWFGVGASLFRPIRISLAFWFVVTHLLLPMTAFSLGWVGHTLFSGSCQHPGWQLLLRHLGILLLAVAALPVFLSAINLIPFGRTTTGWQGRIISSEQLHTNVHAARVGSVATVTSDAFAARLRLRISNRDYSYLRHLSESNRALPPVTGSIVKGFMGVPLDVEIHPIAPESFHENE